MKRLVIYMVLSCFPLLSGMAQVRHGLLFGAGIGFENLKMDTKSADYLNGIRWNDEYDYNFHLGYRFRFEEAEKGKWFFDVDPLMRLQKLKSYTFYPEKGPKDYGDMSVETNDLNFQIALSVSANYKFFKELYVGAGIEPTANIVTNGKHFDIPVVGKILGDAVDTVIGCSSILKNATGIVGIIVLIGIAIIPIIKLTILMAIYYLGAALCQPIANSKIISLLEQMGDTFKTLLGIMCATSVMFIIGTTLIINISNSGMMYR